MKLTFAKTCALIKADQSAYFGRCSFSTVMQTIFSGVGSRVVFWARLSTYFRTRRNILFPLYFFCRLMHTRYCFKFGIDLHSTEKIGGGFCIGHFSGIVVSRFASIGENCTIFQCVTIGERGGGVYPTIGNGVYIGAGAKVLGGIKIGDGAKIGANAVVTRDVPAGETAIGIPARILRKDHKKDED